MLPETERLEIEEHLKEEILAIGVVPRHVAVIMDGNGGGLASAAVPASSATWPAATPSARPSPPPSPSGWKSSPSTPFRSRTGNGRARR